MRAATIAGRVGLLLLLGLIGGAGVSLSGAATLAHPQPPDPLAAARYLAAQRAGYGSPVQAARLAAKADARARAIRARPVAPGAGAPSLSGPWTPLGPIPVTNSYFGARNTGRIDSVAVLPSGPHAGEIFIGAAGGGVWSSTDGGQTWQTHTDQVPTGLAIGALGIDRSNPSIIYAGTGEANNSQDSFYGGGVLKSADGGLTWTVQNPGAVFTGVDFASLAVDPHNGQDLYAGTTHGLYVSSDGGATWAHPAGDPSTQPAYGLVLDPSTTPSTLYVATQGVGLQMSTDGGSTFTTLGGGLPAAGNFGVTALAIGTPSPTQPTANRTLYAAVGLTAMTDPNGGQLSMYKSIDAGQTWTRLPIPAYTNQSYAYGKGTGDQTTYDNTIAVDPADPNHVLAAGIALVESTDGGAHWSNVNGGNFYSAQPNVVHPDFHALAFATSTEVIVGGDGGVYEYNPATPGRTGVSNLNTDQATTQFYANLSVYSNGAQVLGGLQDNGTARYSGASAWPEVITGDGGDNAINPLDARQQFGEGDGDLFATSNTWGASLTITPTGHPSGNFVPPIALVPNPSSPDSPTLFYGGSDLYVTHNPGAGAPAWSAPLTSVGVGVSAIAVAASNPAVMYVGFDNGVLEVSTNATSPTPTFTPISPGVGQWITHIDVSPSDPGSIALSFSDSNTQSSSVPPMVDLGTVTLTGSPTAGYTDITGNLPTGVASNSVVFAAGSLAVATDVGIYSTSSPSGAATAWTAVGTGLPNVQVIGLTVAGNGDLYAATHGRGVWRLSLNGTPAPTVTGISPASGTAAGGSRVTIAGTGLTGASAVNFGAGSARLFTIDSPTQITATSPPGAGTVDVTVTTPGGSSAAGAADRFTYLTGPGVQISGSGAFGGLAVHSQSAPHTLKIGNIGVAPLGIPASGVSLSGPDAGQYRLTGDACSGRQIAPGGSCAVQVAFAPRSLGAHDQAAVRVSDNATSSPQRLPLSGTGLRGARRPAISHLRQSNRRWRLGRALVRLISRAPKRTRMRRAPVGTVITFQLNTRSRVKLSFAEHLRHHRTRSRGSLTLSVPPGTDRIAFEGRLARHRRLGLGTYTMTIVAGNGAARSRRYQLTFTIVK